MTDHSEQVLTAALRVASLQDQVATLESFAHLGKFHQRKYQYAMHQLVTARTRLETLKRARDMSGNLSQWGAR